MGEVIQKTNDAERVFEEKLIRDARNRDKENEEKERNKKEEARRRDLQLISELNEQMKYKQVTRKQEQLQNEDYIKMVIKQDETDKKN